MKTVASFREAYKAHILKGRLEAEGIPAMVTDEHLVSINWLYSQAIGGVKVGVPDELYEDALQIIGNADSRNKDKPEGPKKENETVELHDQCPSCGSDQVSPTLYSKWSLVPSLLFLLPIFFGRKKWHCGVCGSTW